MLEKGIASLVSPVGTAYRNYAPPRAEMPFITFRRISTSASGATHDGVSNLRDVRIQFSTHSAQNDADSALSMAEDLATLLDNWSGMLDTHVIRFTETTNLIDLGYMDDTQTWQASVDAVFYEE